MLLIRHTGLGDHFVHSVKRFQESADLKSAIQTQVHLPSPFQCIVCMISKVLLRFMWRFLFLVKGQQQIITVVLKAG